MCSSQPLLADLKRDADGFNLPIVRGSLPWVSLHMALGRHD